MLTLQTIQNAAEILKDIARRTDLIEAKRLENENQIFLKTENLQLTGSFKLRGAYNKISQLSEAEKAKGIIACSAGNHAQGVALAATRNGIKSIVCMPESAPISKVEATRQLGAEVKLVKGVYDDAYAYACKLRDETGATFVHPFNDELVIAGQGTIGLEILEQLPEVDAIVVPIGGGGLISGVACAVKHLNPKVKIYGVQTAKVPSMKKSLELGHINTLAEASTFADGIAVKTPGELTFSLVQQYVDDIVTVTEDEIAYAILSLMERQKLVAEGAGAVSVAAALAHKLPLEGKKVVCVVSGGNIDLGILDHVATRGLRYSGRRAVFSISTMDKPNALEQVCHIINEHGARLDDISFSENHINTAVNSCIFNLTLETKDFEQIEHVKQALQEAGFRLV